MRHIVWSPESADDLTQALEFVLERNPSAAARLATRLEEIIERLAEGEIHGPKQRLRSGGEVHSWPVPPYRIYYQRDETTLRLLRIYHQSRRPLTR
jgi:plasmid stabilization system protein ParE